MAVPVRGVCGNGHVVNETAPKGRVTWRGPCPVDGCGAYVECRRVPTAAREPAAPPADPKPADQPAGGPKFRRVHGYRDDPAPGFGDNAGGDDPGVPAPAEPGPPDGQPDGDPPGGHAEGVGDDRAGDELERGGRQPEHELTPAELIPGVYG